MQRRPDYASPKLEVDGDAFSSIGATQQAPQLMPMPEPVAIVDRSTQHLREWDPATRPGHAYPEPAPKPVAVKRMRLDRSAPKPKPAPVEEPKPKKRGFEFPKFG